MQVLNRVLSTLLALVLLLGGLLAVVEIVLAALGRPHWLVPHEQWSSWLAEQTFASAVVRAILIGLAVLGLLLLMAALRRLGVRECRTALIPVLTSGRLAGRVPGGFGGYLAGQVAATR